MTCCIGIAHRGRVTIGGDSAGVAGLDLVVRADTKVFSNGPFVFGFTSSFRMGNLLRYALHPPKMHPDVDVMKFMCTDFVDAVRRCLKDGGFATTRDSAEVGGTFLVGYSGRLFTLYSDYQVAESVHGFEAVGCGEAIARGALFAQGDLGANIEPHDRIIRALRAAEAFSAGVRGPFYVESV